MRIASLTPSNTEIVAFLGCLDALVAVDRFSDWPPSVESLEDLGPDLQIDVDRLARMDVDVVLASESVPGMEQIVQEAKAEGLDPLVLAPGSLEEVARDIRRVAGVLGVPERGDALADGFGAGIEAVQEVTGGLDEVSVCWEWWPNPVILAGGAGWMSEVIEVAGGRNVFARRAEESFEATLEEVQARAPERYALCWQGTLARVQEPGRLATREGWNELEAIREGRVLDCSEAFFGRPGPRLVEGIRRLAGALHPGVASGLEAPYAWVPDSLGVFDELGLGKAG